MRYMTRLYLIHSLDRDRDCRDSVIKFCRNIRQNKIDIASTIVEAWSILFLHFDKIQKFFITESLQSRSLDLDCVSNLDEIITISATNSDCKSDSIIKSCDFRTSKGIRKVMKLLSKRAKVILLHSLHLLHTGDLIAWNLIRGWNR